MHEGGEALPEADDVTLCGHREQIPVAPQGDRARRDPLAGHPLGDDVVVVGDLERTETQFAEMGGGERGTAAQGGDMTARDAGDGFGQIHCGHKKTSRNSSREVS